MSHRRSAALVALLVGSGLNAEAAPSPAAPAVRYEVTAHYTIGGTDTGYDYLRVDAAAHRLYVSHSTRVEVLELPSGRKIGEISGMQGLHGIEVVPAVHKGYTSDGKDRTVTVFNRDSLAVLKKISPTGVKPDAILYDAHSKRLYVVNGGSTGDVTVVDPATDAIVGTVALDGTKLENIGFDGRGHGFVNDEEKSVVHVFDTATLKKTAEWSMGTCKEPTGMAVDVPHHRIHSVCANNVMAVLDSDTGHLVAEVTIGSGPDGAAWDPHSHRAFVSNSDGTLDVINEQSPRQYTRTQSVPTGSGARTIAIDEQTGIVYVPTVSFGPAPADGGRKPVLPETFGVLAIAPVPANQPTR
jgi:DNA-binding beta-propeller fold protein YncE